MSEETNYDFSKIGDQRAFYALSIDAQRALVNMAHEEANLIKKLILSGSAVNYDDAIRQIPSSVFNERDFRIIIDADGKVYLDMGAGRTFIGDSHEGVFSREDEGMVVDMERADENMKKILATIDQLIRDSKGNA